ncbi:MAG: HlyC/CorC family transporter [Pseudomonadota bacterium]
MSEISILTLVVVLFVLIGVSAYFSSTETAMMALNRYRVKHLADNNHPGAKRAHELLQRPDRLIGLILLGNNFVNILAAQIATLIGLRLLGQDSLLITTVVLTMVVLIFAEVLPKTYAALHPEAIAFPSSMLLRILMAIFYPFVRVVNAISNTMLNVFDIDPEKRGEDPLDREELRTVVKEAGAMIPTKHKQMLTGILDLEKATVEDIMVPRSEIVALDLDGEWVEILEQLEVCRHTRLPCYRTNPDNVIGILHMRNLTRLVLNKGSVELSDIEGLVVEPYFVPTRTNLHTQLINFQLQRQRIAFCVDEYGELEGLVTLDDLLEEVVGEYTTDPLVYERDIHPQEDGTYLIDATANIRELNRSCGWELPEAGPKTLNGLILEALEDIPEPGTSLRIDNYTLEILHASDTVVKTVRVTPPAQENQIANTSEDVGDDDRDSAEESGQPTIER